MSLLPKTVLHLSLDRKIKCIWISNESFTQNRSIIPLAAHFPMLVPEDNLNNLNDQ